MKKSTDLEFESHSTLMLSRPTSERGRSWLDVHCPRGQDHTYYGDALIVEDRYAADIVRAAAADGLKVS